MFKHHWAMIVLDEAQAIKNASSKRSMTVRELQADFRVALTGTPIENRLSELWSILDFLNPGLLGTNARFQRLYGIPIERNNDETAMERLRNLVSPFILRRIKSDPNIIQDLPDKMENKIYCTLTREQATMYQALVDITMKKIESAQGIARHGQVLALLTHLKQIVDHPAIYQKDGMLSCERSGKVQRLVEMLETILENGEKALIFTQYKEMGDVLVDILSNELNLEDIPFLHGSLTAAQRDVLVADFQSPDGPPIFILSLKAGGTGLNLTAATHVFHFDRWWNPAVEDQATDRAYRIGQDKNVQVHKFLTMGTLEEKIDTMLEEKKTLSDSIVDDTGAWVTQLDADALRELFTLSSDAMIDETD
jgi:SNF2 family DNA or RNA helicase